MLQISQQQMLDAALRCHQAGQLSQAESLYRQILAANPNHAEALHLLGALAHQCGKSDVAVDCIRRAIAVRPVFPVAYSNLGNIFVSLGRFEDAAGAFREAIRQQPGVCDLHNNLGNVLKVMRRYDEALDAYRGAIAINASYFQAHVNMGVVYKEMGRLEEAIACFRKGVELNPKSAEAEHNLATGFNARGLFEEAAAAATRALALKPDLHASRQLLGKALGYSGRLEQALVEFERVVAAAPSLDACSNLGATLVGLGRLDEAVSAFKRGLAFAPQLAGTPDEMKAIADLNNNFGVALIYKGQLDEALACFRRVLAINPDDHITHGNLVFDLLYHCDSTPQQIAEEARRWNDRHAAPLARHIAPHANDRNPDRRLRIGYVSADFRDHPVGRFLLPLFSRHDKSIVEVFCYSEVPAPDGMTRRLQQFADRFDPIVGFSDDAFCQKVRADGIDILVDLSVHTAGNRLRAMARKPAPIQITWLGYPGSTGMTVIDYRVSDNVMDPPGGDESLYSEKTIRLPDCFWCYQSETNPVINVGPLPALSAGHVTFGCLNNFCKVSPPVRAAWMEILRGLPGSRLVLFALAGDHRAALLDMFAAGGIDASRIDLVGKVPTVEYFRRYGGIDIGLDTFPFCGGTTTCDALWMGVPVVTLAGQMPSSRGGASILATLGLSELIAHSPQEYVKNALALAGDVARLSQLRASLRPRMENSALMDANRFARNFESIFRRIWREWCSPR